MDVVGYEVVGIRATHGMCKTVGLGNVLSALSHQGKFHRVVQVSVFSCTFFQRCCGAVMVLLYI